MFVHYTCRHRAAKIRKTRCVLPQPQPFLGGIAVSWWTDLRMPDREALGLTSFVLECDRTEIKFVPLTSMSVTPWVQFSRQFPQKWRDRLEAPGTMPRHWFVTEDPVEVLVDDPFVVDVVDERFGMGRPLPWHSSTQWRGKPRVSPEVALRIQSLRSGGMTLRAIGDLYGISTSHVSRVARKKGGPGE